MLEKTPKALKTIGEAARELNLVHTETGKVKTHIIRFWEKEFPQIKPKIRAKGRRYYTPENINLLKKIFFLLKDKGMTIKGVKKMFQNKISDIQVDDFVRKDIDTYSDITKKKKLKKIKKILCELKNLYNGQKKLS